MRFRKSIKICKGVRLNISGSGVSTTFGGHGLSVTHGRNGTYLNTSIPGTGLSSRRKIGSSPSHTSSGRRNSVYPISETLLPGEALTIQLNEDGTVTFFHGEEQAITDPSLIRSLKKEPSIMAGIEKLNNNRLEAYENHMHQYTHLEQEAVPVYPTSTYQDLYDNMQPNHYQRAVFNEIEPQMDTIEKALAAEAQQHISGLKFWKRKERTQAYIDEHRTEAWNKAHQQWLHRKSQFEASEDVKEAQENQRFQEKFALEKATLKGMLANDRDTLDKIISDWLSQIELPFNCHLEFALQGESVFVDLDLPEIEEMPEKKCQQMANGKVKVKDKPQKERKKDYSDCVFGLALLMASYFFGVAVSAKEVVISGYTQVRNTVGDIQDSYIYSIRFTRDKFMQLDLMAPAKDNCMLFENRCHELASNNFKEITPYSE